MKMCRKGEKIVRKEWVVKDKPTQKEVLHVVDSIKVQEQVNAGLIASDRVDNSELHPLVVDSNVVKDQTSNKDTVPISGSVAAAFVTASKEQEWQTVTRRRAQLQKASGVVSNKGVEGGGSDPSNG
ncbi:hypothetical protein RIF29_25546 [Crotalaria pallida]|uniref:Uncharacterized protein n=1 Tax=Crotalaria pallida TaxID=3830 RepID=A0AAN9ENZ3_CROPI